MNAIDLLEKELASKRAKGIVGTGAMSDPYMPAEAKLNLTGRALEVLKRFRFPVHIITKSDLVLKDLDTLCEINKVHASVCFTITTADDALGRKVEPGAPTVSARFRAARILADHGIQVGITMMPVLPFIEDDEENITRIVTKAHECGASYIVPWFGMSLRDRQRLYYYERLDELFPGLRSKYEARYGNQYQCACANAQRLAEVFHEVRSRFGIGTDVRRAASRTVRQLPLF